MGKFNDLTGQIFGRWFVIKFASNSKNRHSSFLCRCTCGKEKIVIGYTLTHGLSKSCGCLAREQTSKLMTTHGLTKNYRRIFSALTNMKSRCNNPNNKFYKDYGGRGISVCDEWEQSEAKFIEWSLANGYKDNLTIDRKDNNGNYSPENCRWSTNMQQNRNMRSNITLTMDGETKILKDWANIWNLNYVTVGERYRRGDRGDRLKRPVREMSKHV